MGEGVKEGVLVATVAVGDGVVVAVGLCVKVGEGVVVAVGVREGITVRVGEEVLVGVLVWVASPVGKTGREGEPLATLVWGVSVSEFSKSEASGPSPFCPLIMRPSAPPQ